VMPSDPRVLALVVPRARRAGCVKSETALFV
jgi:hypothetical protein